jgi:Na+-translocating ferredoxin:NAD+ oxidoreductase RnfD subunit
VVDVIRTPKGQLLVGFAILLGAAVPSAGGVSLLPNLVAAVVAACAVDMLWLLIDQRRLLLPSSALLTALIVFFVLSSSESWLVVGWTSGFAIVAKRLIHTGREHVFNPAALALLWAPLAFGSGESWWGALVDLPWLWTLALLAVGLVIVDRLNKLPMVLTFLAAYFGLFNVHALNQPQAVAEMFRPPFVQAALFLAFFMLTDPPTSPNRYVDQVWFGALAAVLAVLAQIAGAGQVYLLLGVLGANAVLAAVRVWRRRGQARPIARAASLTQPDLG